MRNPLVAAPGRFRLLLPDLTGAVLGAVLDSGRLTAIVVAVFLICVLGEFFRGRGRRKKAREPFDPVAIGARGEQAVTNLLQAADIPFLHDIYLPVGRTYTQVDHVAAAGRFVLVLEVKAIAGTFYGKAGDRYWTRVMGNGKKTTFQSPIRQNDLHMKAVISAIGSVPIRSLVVFVGNPRFAKGQPDGCLTTKELRAFLKANGQPSRQAANAIERLESLADMAGENGRSLHAASVARAASRR